MQALIVIWFTFLDSDVGNYDRVVIQDLLKEVAQTQQVDASAQKRFKGALPPVLCCYYENLTQPDRLTNCSRLDYLTNSGGDSRSGSVDKGCTGRIASNHGEIYGQPANHHVLQHNF